jgi:uncharacterized protein YecT (DUF1311 family)
MARRRSTSQSLQRSALVLCLASLLTSGAVRAQSESELVIRAACDAVTSTSGHMQCLEEFVGKVDRDFSSLWSRLLASADAASPGAADWKNALTTAQENWVRFREADCNAVLLRSAGARPVMQRTRFLTCRARHTLDRFRSVVNEHFLPDWQHWPPEYRRYFPPK